MLWLIFCTFIVRENGTKTEMHDYLNTHQSLIYKYTSRNYSLKHFLLIVDIIYVIVILLLIETEFWCLTLDG